MGLTVFWLWDWLLLFPKWGRQLGEKDTIGAVMHCHAIVPWMIGLFFTCLQSKAWNTGDYPNGLSTTPRQIITGQAESQHVHLGHATHPKEPNSQRFVCLRVWDCKGFALDVWLAKWCSQFTVLYPGSLHREQQPLNHVPFLHLPIKTQTRTHLANQSACCTF